MAGLILPSRYNQQPQQFESADLGSPLSQSLTGLFNLSSLASANALSRRQVTFLNATGMPVVQTLGGAGLAGNIFAPTDSFQTATLEPSTTELVPGTDATFMWYGCIRNLTYGSIMCRGDDSSGNGTSFQFKVTLAGEASFAYIDTSPAAVTATTSGAAVAQDELVLIIGTKRGNTVSVYCKGKTASASGGNSGLRTSGRGVSLNYAGNSAVSASGGAATHVLAGTWSRAISATEARALQQNPWQLFKAPQRRLWASAGGGPQSLTVTPTGGLAFSGAANVIRSAGKQASGGLTFAGAATVRRGVLRVVSGGITLSGTAAQRRGAVRAPAGGVVFAGTAPYVPTTSSQSRVVTPTGGIVFAGTAPTVRKMRYTPVGGITFGGAAGYTNSGVVAALYAITRRRARPRVFPTQ